MKNADNPVSINNNRCLWLGRASGYVDQRNVRDGECLRAGAASGEGEKNQGYAHTTIILHASVSARRVGSQRASRVVAAWSARALRYSARCRSLANE
jgi:hypothetical protein